MSERGVKNFSIESLRVLRLIWPRSLSLDEIRRIGVSPARRRGSSRLLLRWRKEAEIDRRALAHKLRELRLSEHEFTAFLGAGEAIGRVSRKTSDRQGSFLNDHSTDLPPWAKLIAELLREWDALALNTHVPRLCCEGHSLLGEGLAIPVAFALKTLERRLAGYVPNLKLVLSKQAMSGLREDIALRLTRICAKVLIRELHDAKRAGRLRGATPLERLRSFTTMQARQCAWFKSLLSRYQALPRLLGTVIHNFLESSVRVFIRLQADWKDIAGTWRCVPNRLVVLDFRGRLSDPHKGGQSVCMLTLASDNGNPFTLVYKPRPLSPDGAFYELVNFINGAP